MIRRLVGLSAALLVLAASAPAPAQTVGTPGVSNPVTANLLFSPDNTWNVGANGSNRPLSLFSGGGGVLTTGNLTTSVGQFFQWSGGTRLAGPIDGVMQIEKAAAGGAQPTVSAISTCNAAATGSRSMVTDATVAAATNFGVAVTGGGANTVPVYCDGTSWKIG